MSTLLTVRNLSVSYPTSGEAVAALERVSFEVHRGETLGVVGESGCGKSTLLKALLGLLSAPGRIQEGEARWRGREDLLSMSRSALRAVRGGEIAMIFQDPLESLDPLFSIGDQLQETLRLRARFSRARARREAVRLLQRVHIAGAERRLGDRPHQLSGGMRQRVTIALAIARSPALLLADEPTTALDVTIQDQILSLLAELQEELGMAIVLVSHDLHVIGQHSDRVLVMRAGKILEEGAASKVLSSPNHPHTAALTALLPPTLSYGS